VKRNLSLHHNEVLTGRLSISIEKNGSPLVQIRVLPTCNGESLKLRAFTGRDLSFGGCGTRANSTKKSNLIIRALCPFVGLPQPKCPSIGVEQGTLSAHHFLIAHFGQLVHSPHSPKREVNLPTQHNRALTDSFSISLQKWMAFSWKNGRFSLRPGA
jgi:hypothetical protein